MTRLPTVNSRKLVRLLKKAGFEERHQRGSHLHLNHPARERWVTVPMHQGDIKRPLFRAVLKQAGISEDQFRELQ